MQPNDTYNVQNFTLWGNDDAWFSAIGTYSGPGEMLDILSKIDPCNGCGSRNFGIVEGFDGVSDSLIDEFQVDYSATQSNSGKTSVSAAKAKPPIAPPTAPSNDSSQSNNRKPRNRDYNQRSGGRWQNTRGYPGGGYGYEYNDPIYIPFPVEVPVEIPVTEDRPYFNIMDYVHIILVVIALILLVVFITKSIYSRK